MGVKICLGCMREIGDVERCPYCGFSRDDKVPQFAVKPKTVLHNRYVVGRMLQFDGEGLTYIGYDCSKECAVYIREYMPQNLCTRQGDAILVNVGCDAKYKALKSDFVDLYQHLGELNSLENIIRVYDLFEENNTVYSVYLKYDAVPLNQYLSEQAGELSWKQASELFKPVLESLAVIHSHGVVHRGISPETLMISEDGTMILTGFEICAARVANSELESKVYDGYAAPEQYARMTPHGEWTDVYALCAVLYKVLSGTRPPEANTRNVNDNLIPLVQLNDTVPRAVSEAVMRGMAYDYRNRTSNVRELVAGLYHAGNFTITMDAMTAEHTRYLEEARKKGAQDETQIINPAGEGDEPPAKPVPPWKKVLLLCLPFVLLIAFLLYWVMIGFGCQKKDDNTSSEVSSELSSAISETSEVSSEETSSEVSSEESPAVDLVVVDNFIDMNYDSVIQGNPLYEDKFTFDVKREHTDDEKGTVIGQDIEAGTEVERYTKIILYVSDGPESVNVSWSGMTVEQLKAQLIEQGVSESIISMEAQPSDSVAQNMVIEVQGISAGVDVPINTISRITIIYSSGPAQTDEE
ncbi:protein kinase domain-containing protein [Massiliimalia massiliensis]|uniref:protein kinase domain-containing protein n=1 Tax=Massiliimalia massiliensis TaxID=1852384 RepID=UPI00098633C6|nr:PASTA domain-containing protein [Massiliimalia massiliensis]